MVKYITTIQSKLDQLVIKNEQIIFVTDTKKICVDFNGKRTTFQQIECLETDEERNSLLSPIKTFYYIKNTNALWLYNDTWKQITLNCDDIKNHINTVQIATDEEATEYLADLFN